jgi:hypothetical protein
MTSPKVNYRWWTQDLSGGVHETDVDPDGREVFATFGEARQALGDWFSEMASCYGSARYFARRIRKADLADGKASFGIRAPQKY